MIALILALLIGLTGPALAEQDRYILNTNGSAVMAGAAGDVLIGPGRYSRMEALGDSGLYAATPSGSTLMGVIDADGTALTAFDMSQLSWCGGYIIFTRGELCGVMDAKGRVTIEPAYTRLIGAGDGFLALKTSPLDDLPDDIIRVEADGTARATGAATASGLPALSDGMTEVMNTVGLFGCVDERGGWAIEPAFKWIGAFREGRAAAATGEGFGLIDKSGQWIVQPVYDRVELGGPAGAPAIALGDGFAALLDPQTGRELTRVTAPDADAVYRGDAVMLRAEGRLTLVDLQGALLYEAPDDAVWLDHQSGRIIVQRAPSEEKPFSLVDAEGQTYGAWQSLTFAGLSGGTMYYISARYEAERTDIPERGITFYDEIAGTRRYDLVGENGEVVSAGYIDLTPADGGLIRAETENWIGLIRPSGEVVMRLEKEE